MLVFLFKSHINVGPVKHLLSERGYEQEEYHEEVELRHCHCMHEQTVQVVEHFEVAHQEYGQIEGQDGTKDYDV